MNTISRTLFPAIALAALATTALAQGKPSDFPDDAVEILVYTDPGTSVDRMARVLAPLAEEEIGQPVVVVNRPGGNTTSAMSYLRRRPADGTTIMAHTTTFSSVAAQGVGEITGGEVEYLCSMVEEPMALTVNGDSEFQTAEDSIAAAKADPGGLKASGGAGAGSYPQLFAVSFGEAADIEFTWVPFDSSTEGRRALMAGDLDFLMTSPGSVEGGRMLAVTSGKRFSFAPDTPTLDELGFGFGNGVAWRGLIVKEGTPEETRAYLISVLEKVSERQEWTDFVSSELEAESVLTCGDAFRDATMDEIERTTEQYRSIGIID